ncbi:hypothetical protein GC163_02440 [bacterium]|nr:hypothetical protein [bacterium]
MIPARRLTFQLTPLLDLLLIVIFAQYLDVETTTRKETLALSTTRDLLSAQLDQALAQIINLRERMQELQAEVDLSATRSQEAERYRVQRDLVGELVGEIFRIPQTQLDQLLQQRLSAGPGPSANDVTQLKNRLQSLSGNSPERVIEHLLTFGEMRKRIDLWELYLSDNGALQLVVGDKRFELRGETPEDIATRLFEAYKTLPESKGMVLILFSYGDAQFKRLKGTLDALPLAVERIRLDAGGRSRIEYAVQGFRAATP